MTFYKVFFIFIFLLLLFFVASMNAIKNGREGIRRNSENVLSQHTGIWWRRRDGSATWKGVAVRRWRGFDNTLRARHSLNCQSQLLALYVHGLEWNFYLVHTHTTTHTHTHVIFDISNHWLAWRENIYLYKCVDMCVRVCVCVCARAQVTMNSIPYYSMTQNGYKVYFFSSKVI